MRAEHSTGSGAGRDVDVSVAEQTPEQWSGVGLTNSAPVLR